MQFRSHGRSSVAPQVFPICFAVFAAAYGINAELAAYRKVMYFTLAIMMSGVNAFIG
jgi:hypothetical protein